MLARRLVVWLCAVAALGVLLGPAPTAAAVPLLPSYVAMGDSFSAGEGLSPYANGTQDRCHRSRAGAYPVILTRTATDLPPLSAFVACSGDQTADVVDDDVAGLPAQTSALSEATNVVTLTIGGNDLGFGDILKGCIYTDNPLAPGNHAPGCAGRLQGVVSDKLAFLRGKRSKRDYAPNTSLLKVLEQTHAAAPHAQIYLGGYPSLVGTDEQFLNLGCRVGTGTYRGVNAAALWIGKDDVVWIRELSRQLDNAIAHAVGDARRAGIPATYVPIDDAFAGHNVCEKGTDWINPLTLKTASDGTSTSEPESRSFHPTLAGQQAYANAFAAAIRALPAAKITSRSMAFVTGRPGSSTLTTADARNGTWKVVGALPPGLSLSGSTIQGTPVQAGESTVKLAFTDVLGHVSRAPLVVRVTDPVPDPPVLTYATGMPYASAVRCTSSGWCLAASGVGLVSTRDGAGWNAPVPAPYVWSVSYYDPSPSRPSRLTCPSPGHCLVATSPGGIDRLGGDGGVFETVDGGRTWTQSLPLRDAMVSCADESFCLAVSYHQTFVRQGSTWTEVTSDTLPYDVARLQCVGPDDCYVAGQRKGLWEFTGGRWTTLREWEGDSPVEVNAFSCAADGCFAGASFWGGATEDASALVRWDGHAWVAEDVGDALPAGSRVDALACVDHGCVAVTSTGGSLVRSGGTWRAGPAVPAPAAEDGSALRVQDLACASTTDCSALFGNGDAVRWNGTGWSVDQKRWARAEGELPVIE